MRKTTTKTTSKRLTVLVRKANQINRNYDKLLKEIKRLKRRLRK
jgi:hypothetical protein